jgi:hypothetical protein
MQIKSLCSRNFNSHAVVTSLIDLRIFSDLKDLEAELWVYSDNFAEFIFASSLIEIKSEKEIQVLCLREV